MQPPLKMKDLEAQTGVSREAIHFYLRERLLPEPRRPKRNVAHYSQEHVVRIRAIKQLQQDRALSLDAIRKILSEFDYDALSTGDNLAQFELAVQARVNGDLPTRDQDVAAVMAKTGLSRQFLNDLNDLDVITIKQADGQEALDFRDVSILELWAKVMRLGLDGKAGYDARYLKRYADVIRKLVEFEVENFLAVFGNEPFDDAASMVGEGLGLSNELLGRMRTQAVMRVLHDRVGVAAQQAGGPPGKRHS